MLGERNYLPLLLVFKPLWIIRRLTIMSLPRLKEFGQDAFAIRPFYFSKH